MKVVLGQSAITVVALFLYIKLGKTGVFIRDISKSRQKSFASIDINLFRSIDPRTVSSH